MQFSDSPQRQRPHLALTMGDPASIGPEIILKALSDTNMTETCYLTVIGTRALLEKTYQELHLQGQPLVHPDNLSIIDIPLDPNTIEQIMPGAGIAASGKASFVYLETAIALTL